ncbi:DUF945 domain-containing protein [Vibrio albus]|uniref:DUF945 domain-containing protein n=1 Tax=Vibrio albus TaxID=2200953 RepID=A0A2U3BBB7_9VIBR|nr:DUF945 family protein [Vibrio albus]PWI34014.1 DUF945 domain-containing protein [Vibrio albus]
MQQLKRIGAIGGTVALIACWPLAVGQIGQTLLSDGIAELQKQNNGYSAELVSYERGYLSSVAVTRYSVTDPETKHKLLSDGLPSEMTLKHTINHGVMNLTAETVPVGVPELPAVLHTTTQLNGNTTFELDMDTINRSYDDGSVVAITQPELSGKASVLGEVSFTLDIPLVQLKFANGDTLTLTELKGTGDGKREYGFWLGSHQFDLKKVALLAKGNGPVFQGEEFSYRIHSEKDKLTGKIDSNHILKGSRLVSGDGMVDKAQLDMTWGALDAKTMQVLSQLNHNDHVQRNAAIDEFLSKGLYFSVNNMQVSIGDGRFDSDLKLTLPEGIAHVSEDIGKVFSELKGNVNTFISHEMVKQYPYIKQGLDELIIMEMATETDKGIEIHADISQGSLEFENGQKVPLFPLLLPMFFHQ